MVRACGLCDTISFILTINSIVNLYKVRFISFLIYSQFQNFSAACGCVETVFSSALRTVGVGKLIKSNLTWGSWWTAPCPGSRSPHVRPARDPHPALCSVATCQEPRQGGVSWWTSTTLASCRTHDCPSEHGVWGIGGESVHVPGSQGVEHSLRERCGRGRLGSGLCFTAFAQFCPYVADVLFQWHPKPLQG